MANSINNFVECNPFEEQYDEPNEVTKAAIEEAQSGKLRDAVPVDTSFVEAMFNLLGL